MIAPRLKRHISSFHAPLRIFRFVSDSLRQWLRSGGSASGCVQLEQTARTSTHQSALLWLLAASALLFFFRLDATGLWAPDEPRFAQVAEEMRAQHHGPVDLLVLRLNGEPYTQKPPLYYWLAALLGTPGGHVGEIAARLPSALAGIACIALTFLLAARLSQRPIVGVISGAILLTVFRFGHFTRRAGLDVMLSGFILLALFAMVQLRDARRERGAWFYALHVSLGLAVLTKGPVGLLPIPAFAVFLFWQGNLKQFRNVFPIWSFGLSLGPALLWITAVVALTPSGFFEEAVVDNLFGRFFSGTAHIRPWTYFFVHFPLEFLPWTLLWPLAFSHTRRLAGDSEDSALRSGTRLLTIWIGLCFVFFTLSAGKRGLYMLPTYPPLAILCGLALDRWISARSRLAPGGWAILGAMGLLLAVAGAFIVGRGGLALSAYPGFELPVSMGVGLLTISIGATIAGFIIARRSAPLHRQLLVPLGALFLIEALVFAVAYPAFDAEKSPAPISRSAAALTEPGMPIGVFDHPAMAGGVAYYSGHRVINVREAAGVEAFFEAGGRNIIVKQSKFERVPGAEEFEVLGSSRSGRRKLLIIAPTTATKPPPGT